MDVTAIFKFATDYGLIPVLFVFAFWSIVSESKNRDKVQRELYQKLSEDVEEISRAVASVEESIKRTDINISNTTQNINHVSQEVTEIKYMINVLDAVIKSHMR